MSRKMLITLIVLMVLVLLGLILVQTKMIKTASDIREDQFKRQVNNALNLVAYQLENYERQEAILCARQGRLPSENSQAGNLNVFPRNSANQGQIKFEFNYQESTGNGFFGSYGEYSMEYNSDTILSEHQDSTNSLNQVQQGLDPLRAYNRLDQLRESNGKVVSI